VAPVTSDAERISRWCSLTVGIFCCSWVTLFVVGTHGGAGAQGIFGVLSACLAAGTFWASRVSLRRALARPLPRRGPGRWLVSLPGWLMVLVYLAYWLVLLGLAAVVLPMLFATGSREGLLLGVGPLEMVMAWAQALGWLELRRRQDAVSG
jgi:hypothetical protein